MLCIQDLSVDKGGATICRVPRLDVGRGDRVGIIGDNGTGKSTLLRVLGGLEPAFQGVCRTDVPFRDCVYVHQSPYLLRGSVLANVTYGLSGRGIRRAERKQVARHWLDRLGVGYLEQHRAATLSGGERRRVALARAFATQADLLLLDEPFADLDQDGVAVVCRAIGQLSDATLLIASPRPLPEKLTDRTFRLARPE